MASTKAKAPAEEAPVVTARTTSHTRFKLPLRSGGAGPSTLPPPPFESEAEVPGLEWWLNAHMDLASELLWLEQLLDASVPESGAHVEAVRGLAAKAEAVRDALYELYCDAADERVAPLVGAEALLESRVRVTYAWCRRIVATLAAITSGVRSHGDIRPDWAVVKSGFRRAAELYTPASDALRQAVRDLPIDFTSPIEPLRNLPRDLEQLFASVDELHAALTKRFG
jgi:hypothetical protein